MAFTFLLSSSRTDCLKRVYVKRLLHCQRSEKVKSEKSFRWKAMSSFELSQVRLSLLTEPVKLGAGERTW